MIFERMLIPTKLVNNCRKSPETIAWLDQLHETLRVLEQRWQLAIGPPFDGDEVSCSWVAPVQLRSGQRAILKLGMPHMEAEHEIQGLRFWNGDPTVHLLEADERLNAMLLERAEPGTPLRTLPEPEQDIVIAKLLRRLWRTPPESNPFRPLGEMLHRWAEETRADAHKWPDAGLVQAGLDLFEELPGTAKTEVVLATDLHAGNVLRAEREEWLVIDPKPFVGDPAYDATQHLINSEERLKTDAAGTIHRVADLLEVDRGRVRQWMFARATAEPRDDWSLMGTLPRLM